METTSKRKSGTTNLTVGKPLFQILRFALPLVLGTLFQQLYSFADTVIVGRCLGTDALGAVGTTYSLNFLILGFVQGACVGFGIPVAETFGAKDKGGLRKYLFNGALLCVVLSVVFTLFTTLMAGPLLQLIHTPEELYADAVLYIRIIFLGIPATVLYNYASSVLRAMGDSQHPFYFLLAASVLNIGLDYLLIVSMGMGVDGAALATVLSQLLSGGLCAFWFFTRTAKQEELTFRGQSSLLSAGHCKRLAYIGFPMGFEYSVSAIGAVIMQDAINLLGSTAVAAQTAGEKIRQMFTLPMESVGIFNIDNDHSDRLVIQIDDALWQACRRNANLKNAAWMHSITVLDPDVCNKWDFQSLFVRMAQSQELPAQMRDIVFEAQVSEMMLLITLATGSGQTTAPSSTNVLVQRAVSYLQAHYQDPTLTTVKLAQELYASREHLSRAFKECTMESIHSYLTHLRMQHCRKALEDGVSVLNACTESGFPDYSSFLKTFRRLYGITPAEYRSQNRKKV